MIFKDKKKLIKKSLSVLWWGFTVLLALVLVNVIGAKLTGKVPSAFGYSVVNIISGSMEDEIPQNSYILIKKIDPEDVKRGDVICFYSTDPTIYGMPNTHRVVEDPIVTEAGYEFVTRGDANLINDKVTASGDRLIGIYVKNLDGLTSFSEFLSGNTMFFVIIGLQFALFALVIYNLIIGKRRPAEEESKAENSEETSHPDTPSPKKEDGNAATNDTPDDSPRENEEGEQN